MSNAGYQALTEEELSRLEAEPKIQGGKYTVLPNDWLLKATKELRALRATALPCPLDTAPKDGTKIILMRVFCPDDGEPYIAWVCSGRWSDKWNNWNDGTEPSGLASPTHWLPLFQVPTIQKEGAAA